jgi:hypothetical protein
MKRLILLLIISLPTAGTYAQSDTIAEHYKTKKYDCAIFPTYLINKALEDVKDNMVQPGDTATADKNTPQRFSVDKDAQKFKPTHSDVDFTEVAIEENRVALEKLNPAYVFIAKHLKEYKRQYFGYMGSNKHRMLAIFGFWSDDYDNIWLKQAVFKWNGGNRFWILTFDLSVANFISLETGGME